MELVNRNSYKKFWMLFYIFLVVYTGVMIYLCNELNIWMDEAYTLDTTSSRYSLKGVIHQSYYFESQPPVYFILLWLWRKISDAVVFARMFSLISVGLAAWYFFRSARLISGTETSKWLVILFLLNPFTLFAALEIRLYAFLLFLSAMAVYHYMKYYTAGSKKNLLAFLAICMVALYTQYFFTFLIAGFIFSTLVFKGWKQAFTVGLYVLPVVLLFLPNVLFMSEQLGMVQSQKQVLSLMDRMNLVLHSPQNLLLSLETLLIHHWLRVAILAACAALFVYSYIAASKQNTSSASDYFKVTNFSILTGAAIVAVLAVFIAVTGIDHQDRYFTIALPLFVLSFALIGIHGIFLGRMLFAGFVLYYALLFVYHYKDPVKQYDYKQIAGYVKQTAKPGEPLLFYHGTLALPFGYYYKGDNPFYSLPHEVRMDTSYMVNIKDTAELQQSIAAVAGNPASYLLISDLNLPQYKNDPDRVMVNGYLARHYAITLDTLYFGASKTRSLRIRRLEKKQ
jgi:Dolichyl-phosphate-mannose-protein mannosyltransferase